MNDMAPPNPPIPIRRHAAQSSQNTRRNLVRNVTAENYEAIGSAFIGEYGGAIVALQDGESQGVKWTANPRQWGAWRAYLASHGISVKFMDARGKEGKCWTVPAGWPHDFDGDATVQGDHDAAAWFMRNYRPERLDLASAAKRAATVAAYKSQLPKPHHYPTYKAEEEDPKPKFIDKDKLLQDWERDMAEHLARHARSINPE